MLVLAAIVVGALLGMGMGDQFGGWAGAALGWLVVRSIRQGRLIATLRSTIEAAAIREAAIPSAAPVRPPTVEGIPSPVERPAPTPAKPIPQVPTPEPARAQEAFTPPPPFAPAPEPEPLRPL